MTPTRFQFSLRMLFVVMTLAAVSMAAWSLALSGTREPYRAVFLGIGLLCPSIAVGALLGHPIRGFVVGLLLVLAAAICIGLYEQMYAGDWDLSSLR
jgi:hypothetical protein